MYRAILIFSAVVTASRGVAIAGILGQYHSQNEVHDYAYGYYGGPSAKHESKVHNVTKGGYSYVDASGVLQSVNYTSDEHGFRVHATNLPTKLGHAIVPENRTRAHPVPPSIPSAHLLPPPVQSPVIAYYPSPAPVAPVVHHVPTYSVLFPITHYVPNEAHSRPRRNVYPSYAPVKSLKHSGIALESTYVPVPYGPVPKVYSPYGYEKPIAKPAGPVEYVEKPSYEHTYAYPRSHIPIEEETYDLPEDKPKPVPASAIPAAKLFVPVPTTPTPAPTPAPTTPAPAPTTPPPPAYQPYHSPAHYASPSPPPAPTPAAPVQQHYYSPSPAHYASPSPTPSPRPSPVPSPSSPVPAYQPYHSPAHYASPSPAPTPVPTTPIPAPVSEVYIRPLVKHYAPVPNHYEHPRYVPQPTPAPTTPAPTTLPPTTPPPTTPQPTTPAHVETYYIPHEARAPIPLHPIVEAKPAPVAPVPLVAAKPVPVAPLPAVIATPIRSQFHSQDELGQYTYGYANEISSKHEIKTADGITQGGYSYVDANGHIQTVKYVSDDHHGFRVAATNLPKGPVPVRHDEVVPVPVVVAEHKK